MTALHRYERLPEERVLIYEKCVELLLDTWGKLKHEGLRWQDIQLSKKDQILCLAHLGFVLHKRSQDITSQDTNDEVLDTLRHPRRESGEAVDVPERFLLKEFKNFLSEQMHLPKAEQNKEAERFLELVQTEAGLLIARGTDETGEQLYSFIHRTFQEYFAAIYIYEKSQEEYDETIISDFLKNYVHEPHWHEVILLLLGKPHPKVVTRQLQQVLAGKNRLSSYSNMIRQDLFFVANCLADGIVVTNEFASKVVVGLINLAIESLFPSQRADAIDALGNMLSTKQYAHLAKEALIKLATNNSYSTQITAARALYRHSPEGSDEERQGSQFLLELLKNRQNLSFDQKLQLAGALYRYSPEGSDEMSQGSQFLLELLKNQQNLSFDQKLKLAGTLYIYSARGSDEMSQGSQFLLELLKNWQNLSFNQQIELVETLYRYGPESSDEMSQGRQFLLELLKNRQDLSLNQQIDLVATFYMYGPAGSDEERQGRQFLLELLKNRQDLSLNQQIELAGALYMYSPEGSDEERQGSRFLLELLKNRQNLSFNQQLQLARTLYIYSAGGSDEERRGVPILLELLKNRQDLSLDQQIELAGALYRYSPEESEGKRRGVQILLELLKNRQDLSLDQQIELVTILYKYSPEESKETVVAFDKILQLVQRNDISESNVLKLLKLPLEMNSLNFKERVQALQLLETKFSQEIIVEFIQKNWKDTFGYIMFRDTSTVTPNNTSLTLEVPFIIELINRDYLPIQIRDNMFRILQQLIPLFSPLTEN